MISRPRTQQPIVDQDAEEKIQVAIHPEYHGQTIAIGSTLTKEGRKKLCGLLRQNLDIFAWKPADMTGVSCHIAEHRLNVQEGYFPVRQKKRGKHPRGTRQYVKSMSKGWLSATGNRLKGGIPLRIPFQMLSGRIQWIPSNKNDKGRRVKDSVYHKPKNILLLENAVWIEKYRRDISTSGG
ncbi:hypothetical protein Tco_1426179 [Tanacetum coccineum]